MITSYNEMPVAVYDRLLAIVEGEGTEEEKHLEIVAALSGHTTDELLELPLPEYLALKDQASFVFNQPQPEKVAATYNIGGWELVPCADVKEMSAGQYIDFKTFAGSPKADEVMFLSCFMIPKGHKYNDDYDVVELQKALRENLPITSAVALKAFFLRKWMGLIRSSLACSVTDLERMLKTEKDKTRRGQIEASLTECRNLLKSGDGLQGLTRLLRLPIQLGILSCNGLLSDSSIQSPTPLTRRPKSGGRKRSGSAHTKTS